MDGLDQHSCCIFDFDGTLKQTNAIKHGAYYHVLKDVDDADDILDRLLRDCPGLTRYEMFRQVAHELKLDEADSWIQAYSQTCHQQVLAAPEVAGAGQLLDYCRHKGLQSFICSATPQQQMRQIIRDLGWQDLFRDVYGSPASKEDNFSKAMESAGCRPSDTVVFGDGEDDRKAAEQLGCRFIAVASDNNRFTRKPDELIQNLADLLPDRK